jgi:hypothetical protein
MPTAGDLVGFAYGEDLEGVPQRSLGYRLLAPARPQPWCAEVEALARRLQAAPYPDHWPATDLFCSALLADGRRLVAVARYGLSDHTPSQRRGGLELIGVIAPAGLDVPAALAVYRWLRQRRAGADDLHQLGVSFPLAEALAVPPPDTSPPEPVPVLPVRLWQDGALLFAASSPSGPDHHLRLLEQAAGAFWQWLPLVGPDFPLQTYAARGPLVAWTPHLAGVAVKLERKSAEVPLPRARRLRLPWAVAASLFVTLLALLGLNAWALYALPGRLPVAPSAPSPGPAQPSQATPPAVGKVSEAERDRFAAALYQLLRDRGAERELTADRKELLARYERLARQRPDLRLGAGDDEGKLAVAAVGVLAERNAAHIKEGVRKALAGKLSERLIQAACEEVYDQFAAEMKDAP